MDYQTATVTQLIKGGKPTEWSVRRNVTHEELGTLPATLNEEQVFAVMRLMRKVERDSYRAVERVVQNQVQARAERATQEIELLKAENVRLAEVIEGLTRRKVK